MGSINGLPKLFTFNQKFSHWSGFVPAGGDLGDRMSLEMIIILKVFGGFMLGLLVGVNISIISNKNIEETKNGSK